MLCGEKNSWFTPLVIQSILGAINSLMSLIYGNHRGWLTGLSLFMVLSVSVLSIFIVGFSLAITTFFLHYAANTIADKITPRLCLIIAAWANLPFVVRQIVRMVFMIFMQKPILAPGLSGLVSTSDSISLFAKEVLKQVDIFLVWHLVILYIGTTQFHISTKKRWVIAIVALIGSLLVRCLVNAFLLKINYGVFYYIPLP